MTRYEIDTRISFVFRFRRIVEYYVRPFLQVFLKLRIVNLTQHDRRCALQPDHLFQLAAPQHAIEHALDVADRAGQRHAFADQKIDRQVIEIRMTWPRVYLNFFERHTNELDWPAYAKPPCFRFLREVQFLPVVSEQTADGDVSRNRITRREDTADPMRLIRNWTITFSCDQCVDDAERGLRNSHDVHEAADHVEVAVMMIAPALIDSADPILECAGDWLDVMILRFRYIDDDVGIE